MFDHNYKFLSDLCWNPEKCNNTEEFTKKYVRINYPKSYGEAKKAWELIRRKMRPYEYDLNLPSISTYTFEPYSNLIADQDYPRNNVKEMFTKIYEDKKRYIDHTTDVYLRAKEALLFFEGKSAEASENNNVRVASILRDKVVCDEIITLNYLNENYGSGGCDAEYLLSELNRLIGERERLMLMTENTRASASKYQAMRIMTIGRQYLVELKSRVAAVLAEGGTPEINLTDSLNTNSSIFGFLR